MTIEQKGYQAKLTKKEKQIFEYIMANREEACCYNSVELAEKAGVSDTAVIRFANKLGFEKYPLFKQALLAETYAQKNAKYTQEASYIRLQNQPDIGGKEYYDIIKESFMENLESTFSQNSFEKFQEVSDVIVKAENVYIVGFRMGQGLVDFFGRLMKLTRSNVVCVTDIALVVEELHDISDRDVLVLISYPRYSDNTLAALEYARKTGCKIVSMTDKPTAPVTRNATYVLLSNPQGISFFNSYVSMMTNIEILMSLISRANYRETEQRLRDLETYLDRNRQY